MSYILDALRKADAQRVRDPARGIHALPAGQAPVGATRSRRAEKAMWGAAILILCIAAWLWFARNDVPAAAPTSTPTATATPTPTVSPDRPPGAVLPNHSPPSFASPPATAVLPPPPPPIVAAPRAAPVAPAAGASPTAPVVPAVPPAAGLAAVTPPGPSAPAALAPAVAPVAPAGPATRQPPAPVPPRAAPATAAGADRIYNFADLPADVQQAFPKLAISGGVYSANVAQRMLIVNGQVFNEGSELAPGVVLEQMRPKSAVLRFRGMRVAQPY